MSGHGYRIESWNGQRLDDARQTVTMFRAACRCGWKSSGYAYEVNAVHAGDRHMATTEDAA